MPIFKIHFLGLSPLTVLKRSPSKLPKVFSTTILSH